ncbi:hypothetical protein PUR34_18820 [Streptomyces sp. JV185]|nr:hypothetical protein [Streptomyces sp. JV185]MEE1770141.1 hypothetical protein [Streptomyces sp. JV185]
MLDFDFEVTEPEVLVTHPRRLADRCARSTPPAAERACRRTDEGP